MASSVSLLVSLALGLESSPSFNSSDAMEGTASPSVTTIVFIMELLVELLVSISRLKGATKVKTPLNRKARACCMSTDAVDEEEDDLTSMVRSSSMIRAPMVRVAFKCRTSPSSSWLLWYFNSRLLGLTPGRSNETRYSLSSSRGSGGQPASATIVKGWLNTLGTPC